MVFIQREYRIHTVWLCRDCSSCGKPQLQDLAWLTASVRYGALDIGLSRLLIAGKTANAFSLSAKSVHRIQKTRVVISAVRLGRSPRNRVAGSGNYREPCKGSMIPVRGASGASWNATFFVEGRGKLFAKEFKTRRLETSPTTDGVFASSDTRFGTFSRSRQCLSRLRKMLFST